MKVRCSTTTISAFLFSLCLATVLPTAFFYVSSWSDLSVELPYGAIRNILAPLGFAYLGSVAVSLIVLWTGYRKRERWAWFAMLAVLLFFAFPIFALPMILRTRQIGWSYFIFGLGAFRGGRWLQCGISSLRPYSSAGMDCFPILTMLGPLKFLVMSVALLLPIKEFFWRAVPPQPGVQDKAAPARKRQAWILALGLLLVTASFITHVARNRIAEARRWEAENPQWLARTFVPYNIVYVDLAEAKNAIAMPDAGSDDAINVIVPRSEMAFLFLGQDAVLPSQLGLRIHDKLVHKFDRTVYLSVDARAKYRYAENAISAIRSAGAEKVGLLTLEKALPQPGYLIWTANPRLRSRGLEIFLPPPNKPSTEGFRKQDCAIVVQVLYRANAEPDYKIDGEDVTHAKLQSKLTAIHAKNVERELLLKGDDNLLFSDIVDVIDIAKAANIYRVGLLTTETSVNKSQATSAREPRRKERRAG